MDPSSQTPLSSPTPAVEPLHPDVPKTAAEIAAAHEMSAISFDAAQTPLPQAAVASPEAQQAPLAQPEPVPTSATSAQLLAGPDAPQVAPVPLNPADFLPANANQSSAPSSKAVPVAIILVIFAIALGAAAYFFVAPGILADNYLKLSTSTRAKTKEPIKKALDVLKIPSFSSPSSDPITDVTDLQAAAASVKDAQTALAASRSSLTGLSGLPGTDWSPVTAKAKKQQADNKVYLKAADDYLGGLNDLIIFNQKTLPLAVKLNDLGTEFSSIDLGGDSQAPAKLAVIASAANGTTAQYEAVKPPPDLAASQTEVVQDYTQLASVLRKIAAALKAGDSKSLATAELKGVEIDQHITTSQAAFIDKLQHNSNISAKHDTLAKLVK